ncbi:MAG: hypothetical protein KZQ99_22120 [Candidatus Thiodiazotropha sp. (ex Dulcina madagascariensis)]|nr:hypothetical protein [Candidatus Thiodiazotropha sp. (ex Dulcina madagascariensis)]
MSDLHTFHFIDGPIDKPSNANILFQELGKAATAWARLEQQVEAILLHVNKQEFSDELFKDHPVSFTKKLKILKPWFKKHRALSSFKGSMIEITSKLWELADERNLYLHSILEDFDARSNIAVFHRIIPQGNDKFKLVRSEVPLEVISVFIETVNITNRYLWSLSQELFTTEVISELGNP